jgi:DNA-binding winged helix-turn-helix (wHTH) protein
MTAQYWVGDYFVDLTRNQITQKTDSQIIPPKALAVLTHLAKNANKVVSHDELLAEVWPDTIVTPNTLQRSIAQLRKALGEDGLQSYIKTHSKQGYSLEVEVRWQPMDDSATAHSDQGIAADHSDINSDTHSELAPTSRPESSKFGLTLAAVIAGVIILAIVGVSYLTKPKPASQLTFDRLSSLTATDDKEFDASYTPDGKYIVFHRYLDKQCGNKLWAKNVDTKKEIQLTKEWGTYGNHSFSKDGEKLVFLATEACDKPVTQKDCYDLVSLDFEKALESPQQPSLILQCKNSVVKKPIWLNNNDIVLLQRKSKRWKLITYSISENKSTNLYDRNDGNLVDFAYSLKDDLIAVIRIDNDDVHYIEMLKPDGRILSSHRIERPQEIPKHRPIYPSFDPLNEQLIFSTGRQLFTLSYEGKVAKIDLPFADRMGGPAFHPNGKSLLMIKGPYDSDIVLLRRHELFEKNSIKQTKHTQLEQARSHPSFERSNLGDDNAIFQPDGELIAFWSERSGGQQLWISDRNGSEQLTQFPIDTYINGTDWAADGKSLLVNASNGLTQVFLDSSQKAFPLKHPVIKLFQWDSENNSALLLVRINGILKLVEADFNNSEIYELSDKIILWALKSEDGQLIYKDHLGQFWQPGPAEAQRIERLDRQGGAKSFVIKNNVIYAINSKNQLWSYDLNKEAFEVLGEVGEDVDYLTDINQTELLMTIQVSAKKEVVELSVSE